MASVRQTGPVVTLALQPYHQQTDYIPATPRDYQPGSEKLTDNLIAKVAASFSVNDGVSPSFTCITFFISYLASSPVVSKSLYPNIIPEEEYPSHTEIWLVDIVVALNNYARINPLFSFDSAASHLQQCGLLPMIQPDAQDTDKILGLYRHLIFSLVGISTGLYRPTFDGLFWNSLAIEVMDIEDNHIYPGIIVSDVPMVQSRRPVSDFIRSFGDLLPDSASGDNVPHQNPAPLHADQFNAHVMCSILKMKIAWTSVIGAHLDFDDRAGTVYLFKYPSLCFMHMNQSNIWERYARLTPSPYVALEYQRLTRSSAASCISGDFAAHAGKTSNLMREILLSIYLIFGQTAKAKAQFCADRLHDRKTLGGISAKDDPLFEHLCQDGGSVLEIIRLSKPTYVLSRDFPYLASRLDAINRHIRKHRPKTLAQLWKDNRNTLQWYTFWAVIFIGAGGILLALVQAVLGALQVYYAAKALELEHKNPQ